MKVRPAELADQAQIKTLYEAAFPPKEADLVATLAVDLIDTPQTYSSLAELDSTVCGHIAFSRLQLTEHSDYRASILAPLAVQPDLHKQGIGSQLIRHGLEQLKQQGIHEVYVYGDPNYYGRFGFTDTDNRQTTAPYELTQPFGWQVLELNPTPDVSGQLHCVEALQKPELW